MVSRRTIALSMVALGGVTVAASGHAADPMKAIYVGGWDCPPCTAWKNKYKAGWVASPEYARITWIEVDAPKLKEAYQERYWPGDLKSVLDQLPRKSGTPRFLLVKNGKVVANEFGGGQWSKFLDELRKQLG
ncbi:MAG: hypothetical protein FJX11_21720 [Alphaproteobacteria bacterium]|nr:hypothetical protein [Alphaproteobacteria bacterium]